MERGDAIARDVGLRRRLITFMNFELSTGQSWFVSIHMDRIARRF
jgi:hypothetical protein